MNKLILSLAMALAIVTLAESAEYRNFTNQDGKSIAARVIEYDVDIGKVQLELKTRKKAWVELSTLCEADQTYIKEWHKEKTTEASGSVASNVYPSELSEDQIKKIAEQYTEACLNQDYTAWKNLFHDVGDISETDFSDYRIKNLTRIRIKKVDGYNVHLQIRSKSIKQDGWLQFLPDGKIKYGAILYRHPIPVAFEAQNVLYDNYAEDLNYNLDVNSINKSLFETGIPLFGYRRGRSESEKLKQLDSIKEWLLKTGAQWDRSSPILACPEDQFKACVKKYK